MSSPDAVTEQREKQHEDLDLRSTLDLVLLMNEADATVAAAVRESAAELAAAIDAVVGRLTGDGRLIYAGAGTSGRLAAMDAIECGPTFGLPEGQVLALEGVDGAEEDDEAAGAAAARTAAIVPGDAVVLVSASGSTPYTLGAARTAVEAGALTVAVVCAPGSELGRIADHEVVVETGAELLTGSTRLKAGTAQKLVLNTISTVSMIRLGRTYGNLMVGVVASNVKLRARARRAIALATDVSDAEIDEALVAADGDTKVAILSLLSGTPAAEARRRLDEADGSIRRALESA